MDMQGLVCFALIQITNLKNKIKLLVIQIKTVKGQTWAIHNKHFKNIEIRNRTSSKFIKNR